MRTRRGQALMELTVGLFALALVLSALCVFTVYIVRSLKVQNSLRGSAPQPNAPVKLDVFAETYLGGSHVIKMNEKVIMPPTTVEK